MKKQAVWLLAMLAALAFVGCQTQKVPAQQAVSSADSALAAIHDDALKTVPEELQAVQTQLDSLKEKLDKGDYQGVLAAAPSVNAAISGLKDSIAAKQEEVAQAAAKAKEAWGPLASDVPKMVDAIDSRIQVLSKSRHLPKGVSKDSLAAAKSSLDAIKASWSDAVNSASAGDYSGATSKGQDVKDKATQVMQSLGMSSG